MKLSIPVIVTVAACLTPALAAADDTQFSLDELTCFEVISLPWDDMMFMTGMLIGYVNGKDGNAQTSADTLISTVEKLDATCGENPDMSAVEALS